MKTKRITVWLLVAALFLSAITLVFAGAAKADVKTVSLTSDKIESNYYIGESFTVPDSAEAEIDGQTVTLTMTDAVFVFPDGTVKEKGTYVLTDAGAYSVIYTFTNNGKKYKAQKTFEVGDYKYEFSNDALSASYGDLTMSSSGEKGLTISLSEGEEFIFRAPFNVNDYEWANICKLYPVPVDEEHVDYCGTHYGECTRSLDSAKFFIVKIIDCYNPDNYVEMLLDNNLKDYNVANCGAMYTMARAAGQEWIGLGTNATKDSSDAVLYEESYYHRFTISSTAFPHASYGASSWAGPNFRELAENGGLSFGYNEQTKQVMFNSSERTEKQANWMVNDLDCAEIYGDNLFSGFTTGEVYVSISCSVYRKDVPQTIEIASLLGVEGEDLSSMVTDDKTAPVIKSDIGLENGGSIFVAKDEAFTAPAVTVYDLNFKELNINCYRNYGIDSQSMVCVDGGRFIPTLLGKYTLVYSATDYYGNTSEFTVNLYSVDKKSLEYGEIDVDGISVSGAICTLPKIFAEGLNGEVETTVYATDPSGKKFEVKDYKFDIEYSGAYELEYVFTDGIYTATQTATFNNASQEVVFLDDIILNKYYIKGVKYTIEDYFAYTYSEQGLKAVLCDVYAIADGGEPVKLSEEARAEYTVSAANSLQFMYKYGDNENYSDVLNVIDVSYGKDTDTDYTKYFITTYGIEKSGNSFDFKVNEAGKIEFINPVSVADFSLELEMKAENVNFNVLNIYLKDYASDKTVKISFKKDENDKLLFAQNGGEFVKAGEYRTENGVYGFVQTDFFSGYKVFCQDGKILTNKGDDVVFDLDGFDATTAYLTFEFEDVESESKFVLKKLGSQAFKEKMKEADSVFIVSQQSTLFNLGDTYTIAVPTVNNVLFPVLAGNVYVTVTDDNGEVVEDVNGKPLNKAIMNGEYTVKFDSPGIYVVKYIAIINGSKGKEIETTSKPIALNVADNVKPEISFSNGVNQDTVLNDKKGKTHNICEYSVSDNCTATEDLTVRVAIYNDRYALLDYGVFDSYTFENKGTYTVRVICYDDYGNQASASYTVIVK